MGCTNFELLTPVHKKTGLIETRPNVLGSPMWKPLHRFLILPPPNYVWSCRFRVPLPCVGPLSNIWRGRQNNDKIVHLYHTLPYNSQRQRNSLVGQRWCARWWWLAISSNFYLLVGQGWYSIPISIKLKILTTPPIPPSPVNSEGTIVFSNPELVK